MEWWLPVEGAYWRRPEGPKTDVFRDGKANHPATHVSAFLRSDLVRNLGACHVAGYKYVADGAKVPRNQLRRNGGAATALGVLRRQPAWPSAGASTNETTHTYTQSSETTDKRGPSTAQHFQPRNINCDDER